MTKSKVKYPSKRIEYLVEFVGHPVSFVDVGCDHGFVSIGLSQKKSCRKIIASEISEKCLEKAKQNAAALNTGSKIQFIISDGLKEVKEDKIDSCLIAGMGGEEIVKILTEVPQTLKIKNIYLQPATKVLELKQWLNRNHYKIVKDIILQDRGQFYTMLKVKRGKQKLNDLQLYFGKQNLKNESKDFKNFVKYNIDKLNALGNKMSDKKKKELEMFKKVSEGIKNDK